MTASSAVGERDANGAEWRRLHPLSPMLRGGLGLIVVLGLLFAAVRSRLLDSVIPPEINRLLGPDAGDLFDFLVRRQALAWVLAAALVVVLLIVLGSWISWRFMTFRVTEAVVEVRSGVLFRQHRRAPIDRIQGVDLERQLLARAFGLATVTVQTAGVGGRLSLRYMPYREALALREEILARVSEQRADASPQGAAASLPAVHQGADQQTVSQTEPVPAQPSPGDPQRPAGFTVELDRRVTEFIDDDVSAEATQQNRVVAVPLGRLAGSILLSWDFGIPAFLALASVVAGVLGHSMLFFLVLPFGAVAVAIAFGQFNRGFRFVLSRGSEGVRTGSGLTSLLTETVPYGRIHAVEIFQPLGWRPFGWWRVRVTTAGQASAQSGQGKLQNTVLPVGATDDAIRVVRVLLPAYETGGAESRPAETGSESECNAEARIAPDREVGARLVDPESLTTALLGRGAEGGYTIPGRGAGALLWWGRRRAGVQLAGAHTDHPTLLVRHGGATRSLQILPLLRVQSVMIYRPPVHRLLGLALVRAHTVPGPVRVQARGLNPVQARALFDACAATAVRVQGAEAARRSVQKREVPQHGQVHDQPFEHEEQR